MSETQNIEAQCQIWSMRGAELKESSWLSAGYKSLKEYVATLIEESQRGLRQQGLSYKKYEDLPYCTFGWIDLDSGEKTVVFTSQTEDDLPTYDLELNEDIVLSFNKKD